MLTRYFLSSRSRPSPSQVVARLLDHGARAAAARARAGDREQALALGLDAAAVADRADDRARCPGSRAGAAAGRARRVRGDRDRHLRALDRLLEGQRDRRLEVAAALGRRLRARAARRRRVLKMPDRMSENEPKSAAVAPPPAAAAAERVGAAEHRAAAVVLLALLRVAEDVVGLGDLP